MPKASLFSKIVTWNAVKAAYLKLKAEHFKKIKFDKKSTEILNKLNDSR
jgi:hypothetical protein